MTPEDARHGTYAGAQQHAKDGTDLCDSCRDARYLYVKRMKHRLSRGVRKRVRLGEEAWLRINSASAAQLARATGMRDTTIQHILSRGPDGIVYAATREKLLAAQPAFTPIGIQRRIRALSRIGYGAAAIAREAGCSVDAIRKIRRAPAPPQFVQHAFGMAVVLAFDALADRPVADCASSTRARAEAEKHGWPAPLAWEDIDHDAAAGKSCLFQDCSSVARSRGWCENHYRRWLRSGSPVGTGKMGRPRAATATYTAVHLRLKRERGRAREHTCIECGEPAATWAYDHRDDDYIADDRGRPYSLDLTHYEPLCVPCHNQRDKSAKAVRSSIDEAAIERVLAGDIVPTTFAERVEITRRWQARGRSLSELERCTGWKSDRYTTRGDAA